LAPFACPTRNDRYCSRNNWNSFAFFSSPSAKIGADVKPPSNKEFDVTKDASPNPKASL
jgi:hypothetical protein